MIGCALFATADANAGLTSGYKINRAIVAGYYCSGTITTTTDDESGRTYTSCDGNTLICPAGYYCQELQQIQCPTGKTSSQGSSSEAQCYDPNAPTITMEDDGTVSDTTMGTEDDGAIVVTTAININWKNADGETMSTSTCTYDGLITLPANNPTKKGYTFTGWKTANAENVQASESTIRDTDMATEM